MSDAPAGPNRHRRAEVATFLSFVWPGLGQWYAGRQREAVLFAAPIAAIAGFVAIAALGDVQRAALRLFEPGAALAVLVAILLAGAWRLAAMVDATRGAGGRGRPSGRPAVVLGLLGVVVVAAHLGLATLAWGFHVAQERIFIADPIQPRPTPALTTPAPGETPGPTPTPAPPRDPLARVNVLFVGIDSSPSRDHALTDTLILVSFDPVTKKVAMVSFPRDIANFPLSGGGRFNGKINALLSHARANPEAFPDGPLATLTRELGFLLGIPIEQYAAINMRGFERMIDVVGGVTIVNDRAINDPVYGGWRDGRIGFRLEAGEHTLDGQTALAYARSRKGPGDNDFTRARRQQQILVALRAKLTDPATLPRFGEVLDAAADTITTNVPAEQLGALLELSRDFDPELTRQVVLGPPYARNPPPSVSRGVYMLVIDFERVARLSIQLFGDESLYAQKVGSR